MVKHEFSPVYNKDSKILILGTFPSVKSRAEGFYYGHPRNRFWPLLAALTGETVPATIETRKALALKHGIAIWDVIASCDIHGSSDSSIKNVVPSDLSKVLDEAPIKKIYVNGNKAYELYQKYSYEKTGREVIKLPSTSPANAAFSIERLIDSWQVIKADII